MQPHSSHCSASTKLISVPQIGQKHFVFVPSSISMSLSERCCPSVVGIVASVRPKKRDLRCDDPPRMADRFIGFRSQTETHPVESETEIFRSQLLPQQV